MPEPQPGGNDFDEPEIAGCGFVVAGRQPSGVFQLVDAAFDHVAKGVDIAIDLHRVFPISPRRDDRRAASGLDILANGVRIVAFVCNQHFRRRQIVVHDIVISNVIRDLPGGDRYLHGQAMAVREEVDFGREATF